MISILDRKTDAMIGWISRVITDSHQDSIKNEEIYNCTISRTEPYASLMSKRERIIIQSEEGDYREFVVQSTRESTVSNSKEVYCTGSFLDLNKLKIIEPQILEGQTVRTSASFVLTGIKEWQLGVVEYSDAFDWVIEAHLKGYDALRQISLLSELELRFRITTDGVNVTGRYVDFIKRRGMNRGKEIVFGKDLMGITRKINSERIVTSLKVIAPDKSDGSSTKVTVLNDAAFQNWNHKGEHLIDVYEPDVDPDISVVELTKIGNKELQKRIDAVVEYDIESVSLDHVLGYEHEIVRMGDTAYIKDEYFNPPLYLNARAIFIDRSVFYKAHKKYKLGEVIEYKKEDIMKTWRGLQKIYGAKIISSPTPPPGRKDVLWIKTGGPVEIAHRWDSILNKWLPINGSMTWIMYGEDENGLNMSADATGKTYIGFAYNQTEAEPSMDPLDYSWSLFQGPQGVKGPTGPNGEPTFTWIKYATSITGANMDDNPTDKSYIGIAYNQLSQTESSDPAVYTWALFKGPKGEPGYTPVKGTDYFDGEKGATGTSSYLWVRYSQNINGSGMVTSPTDAKYVGIATTTTAVAPTGYTSYSWSLIKGTDGIEGEPGTDGNTSYLHIKYSNDGGVTLTANSGETVGDWIGTYVDFVSTDSTSVSAYTWNKVKGEKGNDGYTPVKGTDYFDGEKGTTGTSSYLWVRYSQNADGSGMVTSPTNAKYVGIATTTTDTAPTINTTYSWSLIKGTDGIEGEPGTDGNTSYLHIKYSDNGTTFTANNGETVGAYIGTYVDFIAADSLTFSAYTWNKVKGETGPPGKGIASIVEQYYLSTSATTQVGGAWSTTVPAWVDGRYMWTRSVITYTDSSSTTTVPVNVTGGKGTTGGTGTPGVGITNIDVMYYLSTSATSLVGGAWTTTAPAWVDGKYMWSKTVTTYTNATTDESTPANITGSKGSTGQTGAPGKGVTSIVEEYYYSTSATAQTGGAWSTTVPTWVDGMFVWTRAKTTFTDATTSYTSPVNVTGQKGTNGVTTYTWVKYADDVNGSGIADVPTGKRFMGIAVNKTTATESSTAGDYNWSPLYDNVMIGGSNLFTDSSYLSRDVGEVIPMATWGGNVQTGTFTTDVPPGLRGLSEKRVCTVSEAGGGYHDKDRVFLDVGTYTISFWAKSLEADKHHQGYFSCLAEVTTNEYITIPQVSLTTSWKRYAYTINVVNAGTYTRRSIIYIDSTTWLSHFQLEKSNVASDWRLSPNELEDRIDGITVGGRNLFRNSGLFDNLDNWISASIGYQGATPILVGTGTITNAVNIPLESDTEYVFSAKMKFSANYPIEADIPNHIYAQYPGEGAMSALEGAITLMGGSRILPADTWQVITVRFKTKAEPTKVAGFKFHAYTGATYTTKYVEWVKLEKGNRPTDWTPAPEDVKDDTDAAAKSITPFNGGKIFNNPKGASINNNTQPVLGMLHIVTPITSSYMTTIHIKGYNYLGNKSTIDLIVSFYAYSGGIINHSYVNSGDFPVGRVRVGRNSSGQAVILIGDTNTEWAYPAVQVETARVSYTVPPDSFHVGWSMLFDTSITAYTEIVDLGGTDHKADTAFVNTKLRSDLRLNAPLPTSISMDGNGFTASQADINKFARMDYRGLYVQGGAIDIRTSLAALRGVIFDALGLRGYNASGVKTFEIDTNGNAIFAGALSGATGTFSGELEGASGLFKGDIVSSTDSSRGIKITGSGEVRALDPSYSNGRKLFDITDTLALVLDGNQSGGSVNPENFAKIYTRTFNVSIPAASYTTGSRIAINHLISDYTEVAIANVMTVQLAVASKEWRCYETDSTSRVYSGGDLSSLNLSVSPNFAYTSGGTTIQVTMLIVGMR